MQNHGLPRQSAPASTAPLHRLESRGPPSGQCALGRRSHLDGERDRCPWGRRMLRTRDEQGSGRPAPIDLRPHERGHRLRSHRRCCLSPLQQPEPEEPKHATGGTAHASPGDQVRGAGFGHPERVDWMPFFVSGNFRGDQRSAWALPRPSKTKASGLLELHACLSSCKTHTMLLASK